MLNRKRYTAELVSGIKLEIDVICLDGDYTIYQINEDNSLHEIFPNNIDLAKIIADFKEG